MSNVERGEKRRIGIAMSALALAVLLPSGGWAALSSEKCVLAKLAASRAFANCILKGQERNLKKPGPVNDAVCLEKLKAQWDSIEARAGAGVCPAYKRDIFAATFATELREVLDLGIRPRSEILVFDGGPATGQELVEDGPENRCGAAKPADLVCRRTPAVVSNQSYGPVSQVPTEFHFWQDVPLASPSGVPIAADWDTFLNDTWEACLQGSAGPDCTTPAGVLPDGASWWHGYDNASGEERACNDWSPPLAGATAFVGSASTDGAAGHPSPWGGPTEVACDGFTPDDPNRPHLLCLCL